MRRVTGGFDARKMCDRRRYEYVAPAFVFDPTACRERQWYYDEENAKRRAAAEAAAAEVDSSGAAGPSEGDSAAAPLPSPEAAAPQGLGAAAADDAAQPSESALADAAAMPAGGTSAGPAPALAAANGATDGSHPQPGTDACDVSRPAPGSSADMGSPDFRFDRACVERLSGILRQYEGTHCFHNFTVKVAATSPEARRFIVRFRCEGTFEMEVRAALRRQPSCSHPHGAWRSTGNSLRRIHQQMLAGTPPPLRFCSC